MHTYRNHLKIKKLYAVFCHVKVSTIPHLSSDLMALNLNSLRALSKSPTEKQTLHKNTYSSCCVRFW